MVQHSSLGADRTASKNRPLMWAVMASLLLSGHISAQTLYLDNSSQTNAQYAMLAATGLGDAALKPARLTIEMWVKAGAWTQSASGWASIISNTSNSGYDFYLDGTNLYLEVRANGAYRVASLPVSYLTGDQWYHLAGTWNGRQAKLYVNGVLVSSSSDLGSDYDVEYVSATHTIIGGEAGSTGGAEGDHYFHGYYKDIRVWNFARAESEIQRDMHQPLTGSETGLIGYYRLDETSGTSVNNEVVDGPDGTTYNSASWVSATAPFIALATGYATSAQALWGAVGTNDTRTSDGLVMSVGTTLSDGNHMVFGNNNLSGTSGSDLPGGITARSARIWYVDKSGTVTPSIEVDIVAATGESFTPGTASEYSLLYRSGTSGVFTSVATGASIAGDVVTFNPGTVDEGFYAVGGTGSGPLPVQFASLVVQAVGLSAELRWQTSTESNNAGFEVERRGVDSRQSAVASHWEKIGFVAGAGTSTSPREYSFTDAPTPGRYAYRLKQIDHDGSSFYLGEVEVLVGAAPEALHLGEAYPNPFNPTTAIEFAAPTDGFVSVKVYNLVGEEVGTLFAGQAKAGFIHRATFDASHLTSGVYVYRLTAGSQVMSKRMMLMK